MAYLTTINGKLRIDWAASTLILSESEEDPCCCCDCDTEKACTITQNGLNEPEYYGWSVKETDSLNELPIEVSFKYEDSASNGCGGSNSNGQSGNITCCFCLKKETEIEISVYGAVEQQNAGFDFGTLTLDPAGPNFHKVEISSSGLGLQCLMTNKQDTARFKLQAGKYTYIFSANTVDGLWHTGMTHTFSIRDVG
jgi:hypothetical protein